LFSDIEGIQLSNDFERIILHASKVQPQKKGD
jgi:hypothetical protein